LFYKCFGLTETMSELGVVGIVYKRWKWLSGQHPHRDYPDNSYLAVRPQSKPALNRTRCPQAFYMSLEFLLPILWVL